MTIQDILIGLLIIAILGLAGNMGFADELIMEAEEKEARVKRVKDSNKQQLASHYSTVLAHCMNGGVFSFDDYLVFCEKHKNRVSK